jgi:hypothetical protein
MRSNILPGRIIKFVLMSMSRQLNFITGHSYNITSEGKNSGRLSISDVKVGNSKKKNTKQSFRPYGGKKTSILQSRILISVNRIIHQKKKKIKRLLRRHCVVIVKGCYGSIIYICNRGRNHYSLRF